MSNSARTPTTDTPDDRTDDELTNEERGTFERLAETYGDGDIGQICEAVLQSDSEPNEEASS